MNVQVETMQSELNSGKLQLSSDFLKIIVRRVKIVVFNYKYKGKLEH